MNKNAEMKNPVIKIKNPAYVRNIFETSKNIKMKHWISYEIQNKKDKKTKLYIQTKKIISHFENFVYYDCLRWSYF